MYGFFGGCVVLWGIGVFFYLDLWVGVVDCCVVGL